MTDDLISRAEALRRLRLFVEKAERLRMSRFVETLTESGTQFTLTFNRETRPQVTTTFAGPDQEQVEAFVLSFRFFLQDKDVGIRKTPSLLEVSGAQDDELAEFAEARQNLQTFAATRIGVEINGRQPTYGEVIETVVYGRLAHADPKYSKTAAEWLDDPFVSGVILGDFMHALGVYSHWIHFLAEVVRRVLGRTSSL